MENMERTIEITERMEVVDVPILPGLELYGTCSCLKIIRDKETAEIIHVVFFVYHTQHFFYCVSSAPVRAYHDFLWNAISDLCGVDIANPSHFTRLNPSALSGEKSAYGLLSTVFAMRSMEKKGGFYFSFKDVQTVFRAWINEGSRPLESLRTKEEDSYLAGVLRLKQGQGGKVSGSTNIKKAHEAIRKRSQADD